MTADEAASQWAHYLIPLFLVYWVYVRVAHFRFRKHAVEVSGHVLKVFPHSRFTSYFIAYEYEGKGRNAVYQGPPLLRQFEIGASVHILIDGSAPPDVPLPGKTHIVWFGGSGGNCTLADESWLSFSDVLVLGGLAYLTGMRWLLH